MLGVAGSVVLLCGIGVGMSPTNGSVYVYTMNASQTASGLSMTEANQQSASGRVERERENGGRVVTRGSADFQEHQCPFMQTEGEVMVWFGSHTHDVSLGSSSSIPMEVVARVDIPRGTYAIDMVSVSQGGSWSMVVQNESSEVVAVSRPTLGENAGLATIERVFRAVTVEGGVYTVRLHQGEDVASGEREVPICARLTPLQ
jgi:hypothetical protein